MAQGRVSNIYQRATNLPIGEYDGYWSGGMVEFAIDTTVYRADVDIALRGVNIPCVVTVGPVWTTVKTVQYDKSAS